MSFISIFDVIGPNMVGPSSSHTAGAAKIAQTASEIFGKKIKNVKFVLFGSFSKTYKGHGTDKALLGGIMGFSSDDLRIRNSFEIAKEEGIIFGFELNDTERGIHPNTVDIYLESDCGQKMLIRGVSVGGGKIKIESINNVIMNSIDDYLDIIENF